MRFSVASMKTGKPTPSNYLHKQLDVTPTQCLGNALAGKVDSVAKPGGRSPFVCGVNRNAMFIGM